MPILRPPHKSYTVVFEEGLPGDWLGWFINKHYKFPQIKPLQIRDGRIGHQGRYWTPIDRSIYNKHGESWSEKSFPFNTVIDKALEMGYGDFEKLIFKVGPKGHYLNYLYENFDAIHTKEANITNHIVVEFSDNDMLSLYENEIEDRRGHLESHYKHLKILDGVDASTAEREAAEEVMQDSYSTYIQKFNERGIHVDKIDVSKIMRHDVYEYYRLCLIIDSPPLTNWRELATDFVEFSLQNYKTD